MNLFITAICWAVGLAAVHVLAAVLIVSWVAAGESDVNGDPERDASGT